MTGGAGAGAAGNGGFGGAGGNINLSTGAFNMSNVMTSVGQSAAGIMMAAQNNGMNALVQQSANVQANLTLGK